jgi:hypothetical protein
MSDTEMAQAGDAATGNFELCRKIFGPVAKQIRHLNGTRNSFLASPPCGPVVTLLACLPSGSRQVAPR